MDFNRPVYLVTESHFLQANQHCRDLPNSSTATYALLLFTAGLLQTAPVSINYPEIEGKKKVSEGDEAVAKGIGLWGSCGS